MKPIDKAHLVRAKNIVCADCFQALKKNIPVEHKSCFRTLIAIGCDIELKIPERKEPIKAFAKEGNF